MYSKTLVVILLLFTVSCKNSQSSPWANPAPVPVADSNNKAVDENPYRSIALVPAPEGYKRITYPQNSFAYWLAQVQLKKNKTVYLFNGGQKPNQAAQFAVLDIPVGSKDLQQCADAVMRLRATYLFEQREYHAIVFFDNAGKTYRFSAPYTKDHLFKYLETVYGMCGSASLSKQLKKVGLTEIMPGDVLIRGGFPGHAAIVMDVVVNQQGNKKYMLAQSYMPAQDIHVLVNPSNRPSPWYELNNDELITTPEFTFYSHELKRW